MDRKDIYQRINAAKAALKATHPDAKSGYERIAKSAHDKYMQDAKRIFGTNIKTGNIVPPNDARAIIQKVRAAGKKSTLRKYARSARYASSRLLISLIQLIDKQQRKGDWKEVEKLVASPMMASLTKLAAMMPAEYGEDWDAQGRRKGKKSSLLRLPKDWRELMAAKSTGQYRIPMMVALMTGCRPAELEKGIKLKVVNKALYVRIVGAKVKENAGQEYREFRLADNPLTSELMQIMTSNGRHEMTVQVEKGNSVSTHMRNVAQKIWPGRKESITVYTARHAMAADCKAAVDNGASEDLVSQVLGHIVDKTATYYGTRSQSGSVSVVPSNVRVPTKIRHKQRERSKKRMGEGAMPSQNRKSNNRFKR